MKTITYIDNDNITHEKHYDDNVEVIDLLWSIYKY